MRATRSRSGTMRRSAVSFVTRKPPADRGKGAREEPLRRALVTTSGTVAPAARYQTRSPDSSGRLPGCPRPPSIPRGNCATPGRPSGPFWRPVRRVGGAGGAVGRCRPVFGTGAPLSRPIRPLCSAHAGVGRRGGRRRAGCDGPGVYEPGAVPGAGQLRRLVLPEPAQPVLRRAPQDALGKRTRKRRRGRSTGADRVGIGAVGSRAERAARVAAAHGGATRGVRAEACRRAVIRRDRRAAVDHRRGTEDAHASSLRSTARSAGGAVKKNRMWDDQVKQVLDGERELESLPPELRLEAEAARRLLLEAMDRRPVTLSNALEARVMERVRRRAVSPWPVELGI